MEVDCKLCGVLVILAICSGLAESTGPVAELFSAETVWTSASNWGTGMDSAPAFAPDGKSVYFTHSGGGKRTVLISHLDDAVWSKPKTVSFSGTWDDLEPAMAPDGSYLIFVSNRPIREGGAVLDGFFGGKLRPGKGFNLWRVDRVGDDWSKPVRLPDVVNHNSSIYAPSVARNGNIYFTQPDPKTNTARLYRSQFTGRGFAVPEPLSFSDGVNADNDPMIAPDESFIIFTSERSPMPEKQSGIFVAFSEGLDHWKTPIALTPFLNGVEPRLSPDLKTLYFTADRPYFETAPPTQNASSSVTPIPERIWQVSLKSWNAVLSH